MNTTARADLYTRITADIVAQLERGVRPWHQPWANGHSVGPIARPLRSIGKPYRGINVVVLELTAFEKGYSAPPVARLPAGEATRREREKG